MAETFTPVTLTNDTGQKLNATYFNRIETAMETFDDRIAAQELGVLTPVSVTYSATIAINASLGGLFRIIATGNVALADPANGVDGQQIIVQILASGGDRTLTFGAGAAPATILSGQWWQGLLRYNAGAAEWLLDDDLGGGSSGSSSSPTIVEANTQTGTAYTLALADAGKVVERNSASANTTTVPPNSSVAFPTGTVIEVYQHGSGTSSIVAGAGVSIRSRGGSLVSAGQYATLGLRKRGTDEWVLSGDLV